MNTSNLASNPDASRCRYPDARPCQEYALWSTPVPLCRVHADQVRRAGELEIYRIFLRSKLAAQSTDGIKAVTEDLHPALYDYQRAVTLWALRLGRAAIFADCGLGKTQMQLEWARMVGGRVLILAPLCVGAQTVRIAAEFGIKAPVRQVRTLAEIAEGINIANYEIAAKFVDADLRGLVCDESSIIKSVDGKTRKLLLEHFTNIPYRLACTATPCPNDISELANHAEFVGVMKRQEMLATFFVHDDNGWRLRGHAREPFYRWLASWCVAFKSPTDIGFDGSAFVLPELCIEDVTVASPWRRAGELFPGFGLKGIQDRVAVRKASVPHRVTATARLANSVRGQLVVWCGLNAESHAVTRAVADAVEVHGTDSPERKHRIIEEFIDGRIRVLVTKLKIAGLGLNLQCASTMIFLGLGDSYEQYYQGIRRLWRYGQQETVTAWIVLSDHETAIVDNVRRKEREHNTLTKGIIAAMKDYEKAELGLTARQEDSNATASPAVGDSWTLYRGDCVTVMDSLADNSVDLTVTSPPFSSLYTYSASERDLGNCSGLEPFLAHYAFVARQLLRITRPGRLAAVHCQQIPTTLIAHGYIGLQDFRGALIGAHQAAGWIYHGEICIQKNPQAQAIRIHAKGLAFGQLEKDSSWMRPALADYILLFRKPGDNPVIIATDVGREEWIKLAAPVWHGIRETDTLNTAEGREDEDERHICALQLETISNCIRLWSNRGETVLDPFAGIGSTGYVALQLDRRFLGIELKLRYWQVAQRNLARALAQKKQQSLQFEKAD